MAKAKDDKESKADLRNNLANDIANDLNKLDKDSKFAYLDREENPSDIVGYVSTGCSLLDLAISNKPNGGIPFGRVTMFTGLESSGKSLICAHAMANVQKMGGLAVFIDTEKAPFWEFYDAVGVDRTPGKGNWVYAPMTAIEDVFRAVEAVVTRIHNSPNPDKPVVIVVDSLAGSSTYAELAGDYEKEGYGTEKAQVLGRAMRKILDMIANHKVALVFTNQLRMKLNATAFQDPWTTPGGKAVPYASSVIVRLTTMGKLTVKAKETEGEKKEAKVIGVKIQGKVTKNRIGPPFRVAEFDIFFDRGVDNYGSWLKYLRGNDIVTGRADNLMYTDLAGNSHKFDEKTWKSFIDANPAIRDEIYQRICDTTIMAYRTTELSDSDVAVASADDGEE